jgi:hypothetical protein
MKNITAVEWLVAQLTESGKYPFTLKEDLVSINKAKEMEEEQIINAHLTGLIYPIETEVSKQAEQYYNETFKQDEKI